MDNKAQKLEREKEGCEADVKLYTQQIELYTCLKETIEPITGVLPDTYIEVCTKQKKEAETRLADTDKKQQQLMVNRCLLEPALIKKAQELSKNTHALSQRLRKVPKNWDRQVLVGKIQSCIKQALSKASIPRRYVVVEPCQAHTFEVKMQCTTCAGKVISNQSISQSQYWTYECCVPKCPTCGNWPEYGKTAGKQSAAVDSVAVVLNAASALANALAIAGPRILRAGSKKGFIPQTYDYFMEGVGTLPDWKEVQVRQQKQVLYECLICTHAVLKEERVFTSCQNKEEHSLCATCASKVGNTCPFCKQQFPVSNFFSRSQ